MSLAWWLEAQCQYLRLGALAKGVGAGLVPPTYAARELTENAKARLSLDHTPISGTPNTVVCGTVAKFAG
ncbi:hypothetical protein CYLTODRAFT_460669 [Cylindrobasidium torrendii FP15055 ss-10]|uniref:Uncharacterized protein n=1 Tax=Cylindrobasidium torrendii FP15055 ss-10 TaxID=1314674 RepID=A0A0D7AQE3_9AGAR|nr:hypothetical protein CYLTODRAFT_460669 [Cylindrobasidium torrendii FP15055 ss-10]